MVAKVKKTL